MSVRPDGKLANTWDTQLFVGCTETECLRFGLFVNAEKDRYDFCC